jgi:hypothetical protein
VGKMMISVFHVREKELIFLPIDEIDCLSFIDQKPGVCLLCLRDEINKCFLKKTIQFFVENGVIFFITYGRFSESLHDFIDEIIERPDIDLTHISTVSMRNEPNDDVAWFFLNATYLEKEESRYIFVFDKNDKKMKCFMDNLIRVFNS